MLFEPYTRAGMFQRLDAEFTVLHGPRVDFSATCFHKRIGFSWILALGGWMLLAPTWFAMAQSPQSSAASSATATRHPAAPTTKGSQSTAGKTLTAQHPVHHPAHRHRHAKPAATVVAPAPVAPPPPLRPAEQPATPATIEFSNGLLTIHAQNSSLVNILIQIQHQTGLVIEGLSHDQRIYGQYGPGNISTTLSALLDGSGYDFVIVGGGSGHAATRLILSTSGSGGQQTITAPAVTNQEAPPPASEQSGPADPTTPVQPKTPQEIFNEMRRMHPQ